MSTPYDPIPLQTQQFNPYQSMGQATQALSGLAQLQNIRQQSQLMQADTQIQQQNAAAGAQAQQDRAKFIGIAQNDPQNAIHDPNTGLIDMNKFQRWAQQNIPYSYSTYGDNLVKTAANLNDYKTQVANMATSDRNVLGAALSSHVGPDGNAIGTVQQIADTVNSTRPQMTGAGNGMADHVLQGVQQFGGNPQALGQFLAQQARVTMSATTQQDQRRANNSMQNTGGAIQPTAMTGDYGQVPGAPTGVPITNTLSPEAAATRVNVFQNGQAGSVPLGSITPGTPGYTGNTPFGTGRYGSQPGSNPGFVPSAAAMGTPQMVDQMNNHWTGLSNDAGNASKIIGIADNIKSYANGALTGAKSDLDRMNGILAAFGVQPAGDIKTATDLLNKNSAMLINSSGGGSDAQRALISAATPNGHMSKDAVNEAADQVIANAKMSLSAQKYLQPYRQSNDAQGYQSALSQFNNVSDPRIWQFADMNPVQRSAFKSRMTQGEQKDFGAKIRAAEQMGVVQ